MIIIIIWKKQEQNLYIYREYLHWKIEKNGTSGNFFCFWVFVFVSY